jgi:hypothetical protein
VEWSKLKYNPICDPKSASGTEWQAITSNEKIL